MLALVGGFVAGTVSGERPAALTIAGLIGGLWLDLLRMTIVPLVFTLVVTGVARLRSATGQEGGDLGKRLAIVMIGLLFLSAIVAALVAPLLIDLFTIPHDSIVALRTMFPAAVPPVVPGPVEAVRAMIPTNPVAAAAAGAIVPLVIFALVLGVAVGRIEEERSAALVQALNGLADAMVMVIGWVLRVGALGIGALAFSVGASAGVSVLTILAQYVAASLALSVLLIAIGYGWMRFASGVPPWRFARVAAPAQVIAASTQSSLATLPAMILGARSLGIGDRDASVALPIAVAVFKITAPSNTLLVALTLAWMGGVAVSPVQIAMAIPLAVLSSLMILGLPGAISVYASAAPTVIALGAPIELLPILAAVDVIPDMARTVANVTYDLIVTATVAPVTPVGFECESDSLA
ncbi:dicarboxylate/amino acid:cation symporter [Sphingomonas sp. Leaf25]|uniref:dicarboxylate/amino acid:cation symporter n=1 Tax=Sphingomonas sp. Leaf25 TaxID=1735692 RepID=UPI0006F28BB6|nr:cation:dicarboxylase symporter family transporter [Sphingomonas sp. Leaf25]KQM96503.1 hypothetical protein ASE78_10840 [Sphingomonas sp. Leaf25]